MSNLLLDENPLVIIPSLATCIGLNKSIILQQLHYWLKKSKHIKNGRKWIYNTYEEWEPQFPFWSNKTIRRTITALETDGIIISKNFNQKKSDKTKWYTIDYEKLSIVTSPSGQNDQSTRTDCPDGLDKVTTSIITENTSESSSDISSTETRINENDESAGVPTTDLIGKLPSNEIAHTSNFDNVDLIADKFIMLRARGFHLKPDDYNGIKEVMNAGISTDDILNWLEERFKTYKPKHNRDYISTFSYCVPYILDRFTEKQSREEAKNARPKSNHSGDSRTESNDQTELRRLEKVAESKGLIDGEVRDIECDF
ncbi:replication protein [Bacillus sp. RG28]|uniref:Replication protein n=1 Tax=Gottfriedia endophytica TaxID=2820819 RepID=A0A940NNT1_9BACI|nr:replication protein [Gottfriedia endophytica]MBP0725564.1 replication protein [Gottfriedia endophytica]